MHRNSGSTTGTVLPVLKGALSLMSRATKGTATYLELGFRGQGFPNELKIENCAYQEGGDT